MKRLVIAIVLAFAICCTCTSCFTTLLLLSSTQDNISKERTYLNLTIFQTLAEGEALAYTGRDDVVKVISYSDVYYDGKTIHGTFKLIGTYKYVTNDNTEKTVPVYILESELKEQVTI